MQFDFWQLIAGLGLFLFAMRQLEDGLKALAGRSFKRWLQTHTDRPLKGIVAGTIATAFLQSSSLVGLMVLAFVGTSISQDSRTYRYGNTWSSAPSLPRSFNPARRQ
jgi:phosphate:Na+ symporter